MSLLLIDTRRIWLAKEDYTQKFSGKHTFVLYVCVSISALQIGSSVPFKMD